MEARKFTTEFYNYIGSEAERGNVKVTPNPVRLLSGGLQGIADTDLDLVRPNAAKKPTLSAEKAVFTL